MCMLRLGRGSRGAFAQPGLETGRKDGHLGRI